MLEAPTDTRLWSLKAWLTLPALFCLFIVYFPFFFVFNLDKKNEVLINLRKTWHFLTHILRCSFLSK